MSGSGCEATATDNAGIGLVQFCDGAKINVDQSAPYNCADTTSVSLGQHTLTARAVDTSGER